MSSTPHPIVIAGFDGSPAAHFAVERGIDRVGATGHLVVVIAYQAPAGYAGASYYQAMLDDSLGGAEKLMADLESASERLASVDWEPDIVQGPAGPVIAQVAETRDADEIVIGTRGHGRFRAALGSVAMDVLHRAHCPVVVIPERMFATASASKRRREAVAV
jgi:nucleotide-binding universal stress UspA family protein